MASAFGHAALVLGGHKLFSNKVMNRTVLCLGIASAVMPDLDVFFHHITGRSDFAYDYFGHRGITHSIFYAVLWALMLVAIFHRKAKHAFTLGIFYFLCSISHGILDSFTTGGDGIGFLLPFSTERYFAPFRVIKVSPIGIARFFSEWGVRVLKSEFFYIGIPSILLYLLGFLLNKKVYNKEDKNAI